VGRTGTDVLLGGDADDTLDERDGAPDKVSCDAGDADTAVADGVHAVRHAYQLSARRD
jgi:hypothetical protein